MFCKDKSLIIFHLEAVSLAGIVEPYCRKTLKLYLDKRKNVNKLFNAKIFYASGWMNFVVCLLSLLTYVVSLCLLNKIYLDKVFLLPAFSCSLNLKSYKMITYIISQVQQLIVIQRRNIWRYQLNSKNIIDANVRSGSNSFSPQKVRSKICYWWSVTCFIIV